MLKYSKRFTWVIIIFLLFTLFNAFFLYYYISVTQSDASYVNNMGIIRGSIQRYVKLKLNQIPCNSIKMKIDLLLKEYSEMHLTNKTIFNSQVQGGIKNLQEKWTQINKLMDTDPLNIGQIISLSEECWMDADILVGLIQKNIEGMKSYINLLLPATMVNLLIILFIIYLIKTTVNDKLEYNASYDQLTKILNRNTFYESLNHWLSVSQRYGRTFSVIMFDVDHFKEINDHFGHQKGDVVLCLLVRHIQNQLRHSDVFARIGGDEFIITAVETNLADSCQLAEKIRSAVETQGIYENKKITVSLGVTEFRRDDTLNQIIKRADQALYLSKNRGRNKVSIYEKSTSTNPENT